MVPAPITPTLAIVRVGVSDGTSGIFAAARSPWNAWRSARLRRHHPFDEQVAFDLQPLVEGPGAGGLDGIDALQWRREPSGNPPDDVACELEIRLRVGVVDLDVANAFERPLLGDDLVRECPRGYAGSMGAATSAMLVRDDLRKTA